MITQITAPAALALAVVAGTHTPAKSSAIVCKLTALFDSQSQKNAYTYFVPKGWTPNSQLAWGRDPGTFHVMISASTPDKQYEVTQLGNDVYTFKLVRGFDGGIAVNSNSPVHHASEYLHVVLDHAFPAQGISDVEVVDEVNAPISADRVPAWLKNAFVPPGENRTPVNEAGYLQVKFNVGGHSMTAMMGTTVIGFSSTTSFPGNPRSGSQGGFFMVGPTTLLVMPSDAPEQKRREMMAIAGSIHMTPQFRDYLNDLTDHLIKIKTGAFAAGQRYAASTFHERSMAQFHEQMHMKDAYSHAFCNYVSDQQDYKDQSGHVVTAPANFKYAWSDGSGNYLLNDDPTFDMRGIGDGNWKPMQKARIGD